jgi:3-methyladenine DNA glycosylase AlkD
MRRRELFLRDGFEILKETYRLVKGCCFWEARVNVYCCVASKGSGFDLLEIVTRIEQHLNVSLSKNLWRWAVRWIDLTMVAGKCTTGSFPNL